jgi:iron complex transport system substrate-binding protein
VLRTLFVALFLLTATPATGAVAASAGQAAGPGASAPAGAIVATGTPDATPATDCAFPVTRTDATGTAVTVSERPARIVTLSPSAAQTLWELGARDRVVGVSEFASYLNGTASLPKVNTAGGGVDVERVVGLNPDLVLAPGTVPDETVENLRATGVPVFALETSSSVEAVSEKTRLVGRLVGECGAAARTNAWMERNVAAVRGAVADDPAPTGLYVFGGGYTAGAGTFIDDVLTTAGLENLARVVGIEGYAQINREVVSARDPAWLVLNSRDDDVPDDPVYRETTAVREGQVVVVNVHYLNQPAPRSIVRSVRAVATAVHPDAMAGVDYVPRSAVSTPASSPTPTPSPTATPTSTSTSTPTEARGPGLGVVLPPVAGALAALLALARRRV